MYFMIKVFLHLSTTAKATHIHRNCYRKKIVKHPFFITYAPGKQHGHVAQNLSPSSQDFWIIWESELHRIIAFYCRSSFQVQM